MTASRSASVTGAGCATAVNARTVAVMRRTAVLSGIAFWAIVALGLRLTLAAPEACGNLNAGEARAAAGAAQHWIERAQFADGSYVYEFHAAENTRSKDYNEVRHAGVTMALYQAAGRFDDPAALAAADRALTWMLDRLIEHDGWAALPAADGSVAKLGSSALMLVGLAERRLATGDEAHDGTMRRLGDFLASMQRPDGGFHAVWLTGVQAPDTLTTSRYYPGEALWALALLHEALPDGGWDANARAAASFLTTRRDAVESVAFPPLPDHWTAYGLAEMVEWGLRDEEIAYARALAGRFGVIVRTEARRQHGELGTLVWGGHARAAGLGTWVEGLSALWRLSTVDERMHDLRPQLVSRVACGAAVLAARQRDATDAAQFERPDLVEGAWFLDGATRMDDQQHALSALLYASDVASSRTQRAPVLR